MKISELAKATGISTRTLRWYESKGLLIPSSRSDAGHRQYNKQALQRLQMILSLKALGLSLSEISDMLNHSGVSLVSVIDQHREKIADNLKHYQMLFDKLTVISKHLHCNDNMTNIDFLETIKVTHMFEKYHNDKQLQQLKERAESIGPEEIERVQNRWPQLIAEMRECMQQGISCDDVQVQKLAQEWLDLIQAFSGGDWAIEQNVAQGYRENPEFSQKIGLDQELMRYVHQAQQHLS
ncbi:MerR family transcriptional regulator [Marinicella sp. W31]|uniref:MerR family transcriptional regulator n=1 Tax=Marinicella sp. W31 TaxID=3023713 RepID=UPI003757C653